MRPNQTLPECHPTGVRLSQAYVAAKWGFLVRWVEDTGRDGVAGLENLQRQVPEIGPRHLHSSLGTLLTPEARRSIVPALMRPGARVRDVATACAEAAKAMWVAFHLMRPDNPNVSEHVRMLPRARFPRLCLCKTNRVVTRVTRLSAMCIFYERQEHAATRCSDPPRPSHRERPGCDADMGRCPSAEGPVGGRRGLGAYGERSLAQLARSPATCPLLEPPGVR